MSVPSGNGPEPNINITTGLVLRHTPKGSRGQGREAALVDIAQDLLLRRLSMIGLLDELAFKGGTALRKLYAGNAGRFSLDLDFSVAEIGTQAETVLDLLVAEVQGLVIGPFAYGIKERRGKIHLLMSSPELGETEQLDSKLDVSGPPWLTPVRRGWVQMPIHSAYGEPPLPQLLVSRLEENMAEKISRLNQRTPARDMYDLAWVADHLLRQDLDRPLIRRLTVLKVWVDACGVRADDAVWQTAHQGPAFDPEKWLRPRDPDDYDQEDIGVLAVPPPNLVDLSERVSSAYSFLTELDSDEQTVAAAQEKDRSLALQMLRELPGGRLSKIGLR